MIKKQWQLFLLAVMFFTRIPVGSKVPFSEDKLNQSNRYFSAVGLLIAGILSLFYTFIDPLLPISITVTLIIILSVLITGAFHEDGLADMCDGMGGGYTKERRLVIMKDSRIGTFGSVSLILILLLKFQLLVALADQGLLISSLLLAYALSRAIASSLIINTAYVTDESESKSKPLANYQQKSELLACLLVGMLPVLFFVVQNNFLSFITCLFLTLLVFRSSFRYWLLNRVGGFTGDCLGAAQQISEALIYIVISVYFLSEPL